MRIATWLICLSLVGCADRGNDGGGTPTKGQHYGPCHGENECLPDETACILGADATVCLKECSTTADCPSREGGTAMCIDGGCELVCNDTEDCPTGMVCGSTACLWPKEGGDPSSECGGLGSHSSMVNGDSCICDDGYDWCDPDDPEDFRCCASPFEPCSSGNDNHINLNNECVCNEGFEWCNPSDPQDLSCCEP